MMECTCWYPTAWSVPRTGVWLTCLVVVDAPHGVCLLGQWCLSGALGGHVFQLPFCEFVFVAESSQVETSPPISRSEIPR
jgi:F0F1-type ATP synthase assembly protein I